MKGIQKIFKSPFFVSMATAAKFVKPIPMFLAYLVPVTKVQNGRQVQKSSDLGEIWFPSRL
jgi:hypothetical protein